MAARNFDHLDPVSGLRRHGCVRLARRRWHHAVSLSDDQDLPYAEREQLDRGTLRVAVADGGAQAAGQPSDMGAAVPLKPGESVADRDALERRGVPAAAGPRGPGPVGRISPGASTCRARRLVTGRPPFRAPGRGAR